MPRAKKYETHDVPNYLFMHKVRNYAKFNDNRDDITSANKDNICLIDALLQ